MFFLFFCVWVLLVGWLVCLFVFVFLSLSLFSFVKEQVPFSFLLRLTKEAVSERRLEVWVCGWVSWFWSFIRDETTSVFSL